MKTSTRVWLAVAAVIPTGVLLAIPLALSTVTFLRERMHLYCSFLRMGDDDPGAYYCADGIGYILPGLILGFWVGVLLLAVAITSAVLLPRPALATRSLSVLGIAGLVFTVVASLVASAPRAGDGDPPDAAWAGVMVAPSLLFAVASVILLIVALGGFRRFTRTALWVVLALVLPATAVEPSLLFGTIPTLMASAAALLMSYVRVPASLAPAAASSARRG
ncbi:MAG: hypothetical protein ABWX65_09225 [Mycetocola sp.]